MQFGFLLFIDEAGDEGISRVRPIDPDGSPEYFVIAGVIIRSENYQKIKDAVQRIKQNFGLRDVEQLHFRDLDPNQQLLTIRELSKLKFGIVAVVSNKRNMRKYRNKRIEKKVFEVDGHGRIRPQNYSWFYNHMLRYLFERASKSCRRASLKIYNERRPTKVILSERKSFSISQCRAYLEKLKVERHDARYFNNKGSISWDGLDPKFVTVSKSKAEIGLQFADCIASAIHKSVDENWYGSAQSEFVKLLRPHFIAQNGVVRDFGFKLLPDGFSGPASSNQRASLRIVGYDMI